MNVWIALWLVCVSPDRCVSLEDADNKYFETQETCLQHANAEAALMWKELKTNPQASIRFTCIQNKKT